MLAQLLHACGVHLGPSSDLMEPSHDNPEGFWEHVGFVALNDEILHHCGGSWDLPPQVDSAECGIFDQKAHALVDAMRPSAPWAWKDPRNCLTLPFWRHIIPDLRVVLIVRHPLEVAASLHARNGISSTLGFRLWQTYNERLLRSADDEAILVTHYNSFFDDAEAEVTRILEHLRIPRRNCKADLNAIVSSTHRHHYATKRQVAEASIPTAVSELHRALLVRSNRAAADEFAGRPKPGRENSLPRDRDLGRTKGTSADLKTLVAQRTAWAEQSAEEAARLAGLVKELQEELGRRTEWAQQQDRELKRSNEVVAQLQAHLDERTSWALQLDAELNRTRTLVAELQELADERTAWAQEASQELRSSKAWAERINADYQQAQALIAELRGELEAFSA